MQEIRKKFSYLAAFGLLAGCNTEAPTDDAVVAAEAPAEAAACVELGSLAGDMHGGLGAKLRWGAPELACEGMPRPAGEGARMRFSGPHPESGGTLAIIVAMPGLTRHSPAESLPSRITVIEEGNGRFFATVDDSCWADVLSMEPLDDDRERAVGRFYCIRPLAEVNGDATLTLGEFEFTGLIDWSAS